jgi:hypothetical protein
MARAIQSQGLWRSPRGLRHYASGSLRRASFAEKRAVTMRPSADRVIPAQFLSDTGRKGAGLPSIALKTLTNYCGFYNARNEIKGSNQTTNLGVRSSNLFGRANHFNHLTRTLFDHLGCDRCLRTPRGPGRAPRNRDHRRCSIAPKPEARVRQTGHRRPMLCRGFPDAPHRPLDRL